MQVLLSTSFLPPQSTTVSKTTIVLHQQLLVLTSPAQATVTEGSRLPQSRQHLRIPPRSHLRCRLVTPPINGLQRTPSMERFVFFFTSIGIDVMINIMLQLDYNDYGRRQNPMRPPTLFPHATPTRGTPSSTPDPSLTNISRQLGFIM